MANKLISNFGSGGMNVKTSPLIIKDNEVELALNYHADTVGSLTKRLGYTTYASQPVANKTCYGLYQFNDTSGAVGEQLLVSDNSGGTYGVVYYNNSGTWTASSLTADTVSKKTRFFTFLDYVFRVNGNQVVSRSADGATFSTADNVPATITPFFGAVFQDRCYVANGGTSTGSRVWFSSLPSSGAITWTTASDWFDINPDDGDQITALENNGNRLLMFKNRSMYRWTYGQTEPDRLIGCGTSSQESVKTNFDLGITFFANPRGVYAYNPVSSSRPKLISRKIQKFVDAVSDWTNVFGEVDQDHYYLAVGNITVDGRTYTNAMLVYHISLDTWTVYTTSIAVKWMARLMPTSPVEGIYFGSTTGRTYQFLTGTSDLNSSNATTEIAGEILTKEYLLAFPNKTKLNEIHFLSTQRVNANVSYSLDRKDDFTPLTDLKERFNKFPKFKSQDCHSARLKITDNSINTSIIDGFNFNHTPVERT